MRALRVAVLALFLLAACGQAGTDSPTTTEAEVSTTAAPTGGGEGETVNLSDLPQECVDAFVTYLREVEPVIEGVDFNAATADEFEAITAELQPATDAYEAEIDAQGCDDLNLDVTDEEAFAALIDLAQQEAPGTVAYLEWIRDFAGAVTGDGGGGGSVSGDCETDIAAIQEFVDRGGTMSDLTMGEVATVTQLITSISTNCTLTRFQEFTSQEDVMEFMSG